MKANTVIVLDGKTAQALELVAKWEGRDMREYCLDALFAALESSRDGMRMAAGCRDLRKLLGRVEALIGDDKSHIGAAAARDLRISESLARVDAEEQGRADTKLPWRLNRR